MQILRTPRNVTPDVLCIARGFLFCQRFSGVDEMLYIICADGIDLALSDSWKIRSKQSPYCLYWWVYVCVCVCVIEWLSLPISSSKRMNMAFLLTHTHFPLASIIQATSSWKYWFMIIPSFQFWIWPYITKCIPNEWPSYSQCRFCRYGPSCRTFFLCIHTHHGTHPDVDHSDIEPS